jgi:parvulin-like peptidyl-prolyl isomerase
MRIKKVLIFTALIYCFSLKLAFAEVTNKILAVVNDEIVTQQELNDVLGPINMQLQATYKGQELEEKLNQAKKEMLSQLIDDKVLLQEAKKLNIAVGEDEVQSKIEELKNRFPQPEEFAFALEQQGITVKKLESLYREQLMIKELISREVRAKVVVDPQQVTDYYKKHPDDFREPEAIRVSNVLIRTKDVTEETAHSEAEAVLKSLKEGGNFAQLAQEHSQGPNAKDGGEMGFISRGQLLKEIDEVIFNLNAGDTSDLIKTNLGYHIFKVEEKRPGRVKPLEEVRAGISEVLYRQQFDQRFTEWMGKLKKHAYITIK